MLILLALACTETPQDSAEEVLDLRQEWPVPEGFDLSFATPDFVVPALSERQMCTVQTYNGPTIGVSAAKFLQNADFGHHVLMMVSSEDEDDTPDGTLWDCTQTEDLRMEDLQPLITAQPQPDQPFDLALPDGMAIKLREGSRILLQSHYVNTSSDNIWVNDQINLVTEAEDEVVTWAAPWAHTDTSLEIPPGEHSLEVTCTFEQETWLLNIFGHMHEWGTSFSIDHTHLDGSTERIYSINEWDVIFRDAPPQNAYIPEGYHVLAGESFTSTCNWFNDTDEVLDFPHEMCASSGIAFPTVVPIICDTAP